MAVIGLGADHQEGTGRHALQAGGGLDTEGRFQTPHDDVIARVGATARRSPSTILCCCRSRARSLAMPSLVWTPRTGRRAVAPRGQYRVADFLPVQ
jgi:hypothetical protein